MKKLDFNQMEKIQGGGRAEACKVLNYTVYAAGIGSFFGPAGALIFGPTAIIGGAFSLAFC